MATLPKIEPKAVPKPAPTATPIPAPKANPVEAVGVHPEFLWLFMRLILVRTVLRLNYNVSRGL